MTHRPLYPAAPALALALAGCAAKPPPAAPVAPAPAPTASARWVARFAPEFVYRWSAQTGPRDTRLIFGSGIRVAVDGATAHVAGETLLEPIVTADRVADGWLFVTGSQGLLASTSADGPLRPVEPLDTRGVDAVVCGGERAVVRTLEGGAAAVGADFTVRELDLPGRGLIDGCFADARFGAFSVAPDGLYYTTDGGATVSRAALSDPVRAVYAHAGGIRLATTRATLALERDGSTHPADLPAPLDPVDDSAAFAQATEALAAALPLHRLLAPPAQDGTLLLEGDDTIELVRPGVAPVVLATPDEACGYVLREHTAYAHCPGESLHRVFRSVEGRPWEPVRALASEDFRFQRSFAQLVPSSDGVDVVANVACNNARENESGWCWVHGDAARDIAPHGIEQAVAVIDGALVYLARESDDISHEEAVERGFLPRVLNLAGDAPAQPIAVGDEGDARVLALSAAADGTLHGWARQGSERFAVRGTVAAGLGRFELPEGARSFAFADARHALAVGDDLSAMWTTEDGGRSWERAAPPVEGNAALIDAQVLVRSLMPFERSVECGAGGCMVERKFLWAPPDTSARLIGCCDRPRAPARLHEHREDPDLELQYGEAYWARSRGHGRWACQQDPRPDPAREHDLSRVEEPYPPRVMLGADGWAQWSGDAATPYTAGPVSIAWGGRDERGAFTAHSRRATLPALDAPEQRDEPPTYSLLGVTRRLAVVLRCGPGRDAAPPGNADDADVFVPPPACDVLVATNGGPPRVLTAVRDVLLAPDNPVHASGALALPGGGLAVQFHAEPLAFEAGVAYATAQGDAVVEIGADGRLGARRSVVPAPYLPGYIALGFDGERAGLVALYVGGAAEFFPAGDGPARALRLNTTGPYPICADGPLAPGAVRVLMTRQPLAPMTSVIYHRQITSADATYPLLDMAPGSTCLRGYRSLAIHPDATRYLRPDWGTIHVDARGGALRGYALNREIATPIACAPYTEN